MRRSRADTKTYNSFNLLGFINSISSSNHAAQSAFANTASGKSYDYIFTGCGCAALSLLMRMLQNGTAAGKKILLIDRDAKQRNDRTWCFWEAAENLFEPIVYKRWQQLYFYADKFSGPLHITPYTYKLIRGIDFYNYCLTQLKQHANIELLQANIELVSGTNGHAYALTDKGRFDASFIFNSILPPRPQLQPHQYWLLQHFKGWVIETEQDVFDPAQATLMDFRVSQHNGTTFVYVLPFAPNRALVEYTLFSKNLLEQDEYDKALHQYLQHFLSIEKYSIVEKEFGVIPMTNIDFPQRAGNVLNIGTAGGHTKASSGYTFRAIQKASEGIAASLNKRGHPFDMDHASSRFSFYDSVLLHILNYDKLRGADIFAQLFQKNGGANVLRFLDNETTLLQELKIISSLPTLPFSKAALEYLTAKFLKG